MKILVTHLVTVFCFQSECGGWWWHWLQTNLSELLTFTSCFTGRDSAALQTFLSVAISWGRDDKRKERHYPFPLTQTWLKPYYLAFTVEDEVVERTRNKETRVNLRVVWALCIYSQLLWKFVSLHWIWSKFGWIVQVHNTLPAICEQVTRIGFSGIKHCTDSINGFLVKSSAIFCTLPFLWLKRFKSYRHAY